MALHLIPDDGSPHAPTSECACGPILLGDSRTYAHANTEAYDMACTYIVYQRPTYHFELRDAPLTLAKLREFEATRPR